VIRAVLLRARCPPHALRGGARRPTTADGVPTPSPKEILGAMVGWRAWAGLCHNGGDIALYLADGEQFTVGLDRPDDHGLMRTMVIRR
jgi:hypothetical protein